MNGDIGIVEELGLAVFYKREVVTVNACRNASRQFDVPVLSFDVYDIYVIALLVKEGLESLC